MRPRPAEPADTPRQAAQANAMADEKCERSRAVLDRALRMPESLRLGFLLRELNGRTKGNA
jgi:hypothetical protein